METGCGVRRVKSLVMLDSMISRSTSIEGVSRVVMGSPGAGAYILGGVKEGCGIGGVFLGGNFLGEFGDVKEVR